MQTCCAHIYLISPGDDRQTVLTDLLSGEEMSGLGCEHRAVLCGTFCPLPLNISSSVSRSTSQAVV